MWPDGERSLEDGPARGSESSDVEIFTGQMVAAATRQAPGAQPINANVTRSRQVYVGTNFLTINQPVLNNDVVKGNFLCLEMVSPEQSRRLRCSVAVFVCWALIVAGGLAAFLFFAMYNRQTRLDLIGLKEDWYLRRDDWHALPAFDVEYLELPVQYAVITHSALPYCNETVACINQVISIQQQHQRQRMDDIGPNFIVSGNGLVFEGRGANVVGAVVQGHNRKIITIMFLGDYRGDVPTKLQFEHVDVLLDALVEAGALSRDYTLYGACQLQTYIVNPGKEIMHRIQHFTHWDPKDAYKCLNQTKNDN